MEPSSKLFVGTAGWSIPREVAARFPSQGAALERYAQRLDGAEINTTFYRPHQPATFERWAAATPDGFRFAVKAPKTITHTARLVDTETLLSGFLDQARNLGQKLGPILFQLPPSLRFDPATAARFFSDFRDRHDGSAAAEPRHESWFGDEASELLVASRIARVAADPPRGPGADRPGGWPGLAYFRWHGSPRVYFSSYEAGRLTALRHDIEAGGAIESWVIFDNTASGAAARNALDFVAL